MKNITVFVSVLLILGLVPASVAQGSEVSSQGLHGTCLKFSLDRSQCNECVNIFHLYEGECYMNIHGCTEYVFGNICRQCEAGYILVNNECCDRHCMERIFGQYPEQGSSAQET